MERERNGFDPHVITSFVSRIEALQEGLREEAEAVRKQIKGVVQEAEDKAGVPPKALKMVLRKRAFAEKIEALDDEDARALAHLEAALSDLDREPALPSPAAKAEAERRHTPKQ